MADVKITFQSFSHFQVKKVLDNFRLCNLATVINRALLIHYPKGYDCLEMSHYFWYNISNNIEAVDFVIFIPNVILNIRSYVQVKNLGENALLLFVIILWSYCLWTSSISSEIYSIQRLFPILNNRMQFESW